MRIQWSGNTAQEMLYRLKRANDAMKDCENLAVYIRQTIDEANPDGDDKALCKISTHFEGNLQKLRAFAEGLEQTCLAIQKADEIFSDAEHRIGNMADNVSAVSEAPAQLSASPSKYIDWNAPVYATTPAMHAAAPLPGAFAELIEEPDIIESLKR